jgi:hypothetical protein
MNAFMTPGVTRILMLGAVMTLAAGTAAAHDDFDFEDHSSSQQTLHFASTGAHSLEVRAITGAITIEAYEGPDVEVLINKTIYARNRAGLEDAAREVKLDASDAGGAISLVVRYPHEATCGEKHVHWRNWAEHSYDVRYDFTIRVPKDTRLELCTINRGDIAVNGTRADFSIHTINGRITMTDVAGSGEATTINGRVTAAFAAAPRDASLFKTINGDVVLEMPDSLAADLRMKTFNGGLYTDFEVQPLPTMVNVATRREDGRFVYRTTGFTSVRAGAGGPELTLETLNGDVRVLRHSK